MSLEERGDFYRARNGSDRASGKGKRQIGLSINTNGIYIKYPRSKNL